MMRAALPYGPRSLIRTIDRCGRSSGSCTRTRVPHRQRAVRRGHRVLVEALARRRRPAVVLAAVPARVARSCTPARLRGVDRACRAASPAVGSCARRRSDRRRREREHASASATPLSPRCTRRRARGPALSSAALRSCAPVGPSPSCLRALLAVARPDDVAQVRLVAGTCRCAPWCGTASRTAHPPGCARSRAASPRRPWRRGSSRGRGRSRTARRAACSLCARFEPPGLSQPVTWQPMQSKSNCWPRSSSVFHALRVHASSSRTSTASAWQSLARLVADVARPGPSAAAAPATLAAALTLASPAAR